MVSDAWRNMGATERAKYDAMAREDKARYELEKASYTAPPGVASAKKQRDPNAPKRPMSAFLAFANSRRGAVKGQNQDCSNGEISKVRSVDGQLRIFRRF
jgi:high mobility group protein B4